MSSRSSSSSARPLRSSKRGGLEKPTDGQHERAFLQFGDVAHPRDQPVAIGIDRHGGKDGDLTILSGQHPGNRPALVEAPAIVDTDDDRRTKERERVGSLCQQYDVGRKDCC